MNITDQFIENLITFSNRQFEESDNLHAKKCLLDYVGVTLAGAKEYDTVENSLLNTWLGGTMATVIGRMEKVSAPVAALINGISSHAVELDDGQRYGNIHPGSPVISALLSVGESADCKLGDLLIGLLTGYECVLRLACSIQPNHKLKGFHATGPCGTIGAAIGIAAMMKFDALQYKSTLSAACTSASGILEMIEGDTQMMPYNAGKAAMSGVVSACIGKAGFKCPDDALGGKRGFLNCFANEPNIDLLVDFADKEFFSTNYFKLYAACGHCHAGIDAALKLRSRKLFSIDDIDHIVVETYKLALLGHDHNIIDGVNSAKMSIPYSVAVAMIKGKAGIDEFTNSAIKEERVIRLASKTTVRDNDEITKLSPQKRIAVVHVYTKDNVFTEKVDYPKGQPENPLSISEMKQKFYDMCGYAHFSMKKAQNVTDIILNGDDDCSVLDLMHLLGWKNIHLTNK